RNHPQDALERSHPLERAKLRAKVVERKLVLAKLLLELFRLTFPNRRLRLLDEREDVAHTENARHDPVGMKELEILEALSAADEGDRHADDGHHRQRSAAARVAIEFGQ